MKKSYILCVILTFCFVGCIGPKVTYNNEWFNPENKNIQKVTRAVNAESSDRSVIVFTSYYDKDTIRVINGDKITFNEVVETSVEIGFSTFTGVTNEKPVKIQALTPEFYEVKLKRSDLKKYKFVYIYRHSEKRNKFRLEYSNKWKGFQ